MQISNLQQSKTRSRYIVISTVFLLLFINPLSVFTTTSRVCAAERPSFNLDYSVWKATHIVLATESGTIDGRLKVVESWKGDIKPGMELILPELGAFADEKSRRVQYLWKRPDLPEPYVRFVTGSRIVLFLVKATEPHQAGMPDSKTPVWLPSNYAGHGSFKTSVAWIENGEGYAFVQVINPGPSVLIHLGTAIEIKARVAAFNVIQIALDRAVTDQDPVLAAQSFRTFHRFKFYNAAGATLKSLGRMGKAALATLRQLLADITLRSWHKNIISAMAAAGGADVAEDLTAIIAEGLEFFSRCAPDLKKGWWNADPPDQRRRLREEYGRLLTALRALQPLRYFPSRDLVSKVNDLWRSNARLSFNGQSQVLTVCDTILNELAGRDEMQ